MTIKREIEGVEHEFVLNASELRKASKEYKEKEARNDVKYWLEEYVEDSDYEDIKITDELVDKITFDYLQNCDNSHAITEDMYNEFIHAANSSLDAELEKLKTKSKSIER